MARPRVLKGDVERLNMVITTGELKAIEQWRYATQVPSKSEAIRRLCQIGLAADEVLAGMPERILELMASQTDLPSRIDAALTKGWSPEALADLQRASQDNWTEQDRLFTQLLGLAVAVRRLRGRGSVEADATEADELIGAARATSDRLLVGMLDDEKDRKP